MHYLLEGTMLITAHDVFVRLTASLVFFFPDTLAGTSARHASTTRMLLMCRWKQRARLRVNMDNTRTQYNSFALVSALEYTCNVYFLQTMPVSSC